MNQITGYLPLSAVGGRDYQNNLWRTNLLIKSLHKFFVSPLVIFIVSPPSELKFIQEALVPTDKVSLRFIDQEEILPGVTEAPGIGWYKQQMLSLQIPLIYPELNLLKLDPDLVLVDVVDHADFFFEGKTANDIWHMQANPYVKPYVNSSNILNLEIQNLSPGLKWTPFIFDPRVCDVVLGQLKKQTLTLLDLWNKPPWTETLLYNIAGNAMSSISDFHFHAPLIGSTLANSRQIFNFRIKPTEGIFATLQGFTGVSEPQVNAILANSKIVL